MRTLRARLILSHLLPVLVILPLVIILFVYLVETQVSLSGYTNEITRQSILVSDVAGDYLEIWFDTDRAQAFVDRTSETLTADILLFNPQGTLLVSSDPNDKSKIGQVIFKPDLNKLLAGGEKHAEITYRGGTIQNVTVPVVTPFNDLIGFVRMVNPLAGVFERSQQLRQIAALVVGIGLLLGGILGWILALDIQRPLARATHAAYDLSVGRQLTPLKEEGPEEIRLLLRAFNTLVERLKAMEDSRRKLLANLVHELGRPLGALQSAVQALAGGADEDPGLSRELLTGMDDELHRMRRLVDDLASLHEQVLGSLELTIQPVQTSDWLKKVAVPWREMALERGLQWQTDIPDDLPDLMIDPDRMAQAVGNLLSNAVRYTPGGGKISLAARARQERLEIDVTDTGPGIQADEQSSIFSPFYRGKAARRFSDGMGLGLTIARDLIQGHGGTLTVESDLGQGSKFVLSIPLRSTGDEPGESYSAA